jgi:hypothetical protein
MLVGNIFISLREKMIKLFVIFFLFSSLYAEEIVTTKDGRRVKLKDDYTWRYLKEKPIDKTQKNDLTVKILNKKDEQVTEVVSKSGVFSVFLNEKKWIQSPPLNGMAEFAFLNEQKNGFAMLIYEGIEIPLDTYESLILENAKNADANASILGTQECTVNGRKGRLVKYKAAPKGLKLIFYTFITSDSASSIQFTTYTTENKFEEEVANFEYLISGLVFK